MKLLPTLNLLERLALWLLVRSPRTSLVVVKEHFWPQAFFAADPRDPVARFVAAGANEQDPPSLVLERIFHAPAYGEQE